MGQLRPLSSRAGCTGVVAGVTITVAVLQYTLAPNEPSLIAHVLGTGFSVLIIGLLVVATWGSCNGDFVGGRPLQVAGATVLGLLVGLFVSSGSMIYQEVTTPSLDMWRLANQGYVVLLFGSIGSLMGWLVGIERARTHEKYEQKLDHYREHRKQAERLEHLASILAHDIRNPLNVAQGRLEMANETGGERHYMAARRAIDRIDSIISESVVLAQEGRVRNQLEATSLADVAHVAWEVIAADKVDLIIEENGTIVADSNSLQHVFENLFINAISHGGETLSEIRVGRTTLGFYVEDDGVGLEGSYTQDIFAPGMSTEPNGTGLGLTIVETIADSHDWTVSVKPQTDGGARFEFENVRFERSDSRDETSKSGGRGRG